MKTLSILLVIVVAFASVLFADDPPAEPANSDATPEEGSPTVNTEVEQVEQDVVLTDSAMVTPAPNNEQEESVELSTELEGLDSLDIAPTEIITQVGSGVRRVSLESSVFRREQPVFYEATGRRDPFRALITDEKKEGEIETDLLRLEGAMLKGVVWSDGHYLALIADKDGKSFVLREGDPVFQGRLISVTQSKAVFEVADFGDYQQITLKVKG